MKESQLRHLLPNELKFYIVLSQNIAYETHKTGGNLYGKTLC